MPTRYFEVSPIATGLAYGMAGLTDRLQQIQREHEAETERRKAQQRRVAFGVGGAALGAVGGIALAPALGLGGGAAGAAIPSIAGGHAVGAGASGFGTLAAGLFGASAGARAGQAFAEGDIAGGVEAVSRPVVAEAFHQRGRAEGLADFGARQRISTNEDIRRAVEARSIREFGLPRAEADAQAEANYDALLRSLPQAGEMLPSEPPMADLPAFGPIPDEPPEPNIPGPSRVPGMKRDWNPYQRGQIARLEQKRAETVDNPGWISSHSPEQRAAAFDALTEARQAIRVTTMPDEPKMTTITPSGERVPMLPGPNLAPDGGWDYMNADGTFEQHVQPPKSNTDNITSDWTPEQHADYVAKHVTTMPDGSKVLVQPDGQLSIHEPRDDGTDKVNRQRFENTRKAMVTKNAVGTDVQPSTEKVLERMQADDEALAEYEDIQKFGKKIADRRALLRETMRKMRDDFPGGVATMPQNQRRQWEEFKAEYLSYE